MVVCCVGAPFCGLSVRNSLYYIPQAAKVGGQAQLVRNCRALLKRLTTEVEINKAITGFPTVRLPIDVSKYT